MKSALALFPVLTVALLLANTPAHAASRTDNRIEASARKSYVFQNYLKGDDINIRSRDGVVTLTGSVLEESHKSLAQETVAELPGVKKVDNRLEVKDASSMAQKELATEYAKDVEGVKDVMNEMTISGASTRKDETVGGKIDDASITAQVKMTLLYHRSTSAVGTKVKTKNGVVTVSGKAGNAAEKALVTKLAGDVHGVKNVTNRMTVTGSK